MKTFAHNWTVTETQLLINLWQDRVSVVEIADIMHMEMDKIKSKVVSLRNSGVSLDKRQRGRRAGDKDKYPKKPPLKQGPVVRICLACRKKFSPTHAGNFICRSCTSSNANKAGAMD